MPRQTCPVCAADRAEAVFGEAEWAADAQRQGGVKALLAGALAAEPRLGFGRMLRCRGCGTLFTETVPPGDVLDAFYGTYYGTDGYRTKVAGKLALAGRQVLALRLLVRGRRFLDVGCNIGCAVEAARRRGFAATGVELSADAVAIGRSLFPACRFVQGTLAAIPAEERFDLVMCTEVVEHVPDPAGFLAELTGRVAPRGLLLLTTPNGGGRAAEADPMRWAEMKPPEHQQLLTRAGLGLALRRVGLRSYFLPVLKGGLQLLARRPAGGVVG